mgnify:CR=1 FL=1
MVDRPHAIMTLNRRNHPPWIRLHLQLLSNLSLTLFDFSVDSTGMFRCEPFDRMNFHCIDQAVHSKTQPAVREFSMAQKYQKDCITIPEGFPEVLKSFTREVLRSQVNSIPGQVPACSVSLVRLAVCGPAGDSCLLLSSSWL